MPRPMAVSTGLAIMGSRVIATVITKYTIGKIRLTLIGLARFGAFQRRQGRQNTAAPMLSQVANPRQFINTDMLLKKNNYFKFNRENYSSLKLQGLTEKLDRMKITQRNCTEKYYHQSDRNKSKLLQNKQTQIQYVLYNVINDINNYILKLQLATFCKDFIKIQDQYKILCEKK